LFCKTELKKQQQLKLKQKSQLLVAKMKSVIGLKKPRRKRKKSQKKMRAQ
jgi:hypothetical protein